MPDADETISMIFTLAPGVDADEATRILRGAGIRISEPLAQLGMLIGAGRRSLLAPLQARRDYFADVAEDGPVRIAPPGAPLQ